MFDVNEETKVAEKIGSEDWPLNISNDEDPGKRSVKTKVKSERSFAKGLNGSIVDCGESEFVGCESTVAKRGRNNANFGPCINEKLHVCVVVSYMEKATCKMAGSTCRRERPA